VPFGALAAAQATGPALELVELSPEERAQLEEEAIALELAERDRAPLDFGIWLRRYLPDVFTANHGAFHRGIHRDLIALLNGLEIEGHAWDAAAYAYPRGHGKTSTLVFGLILYVLCEWRRLPHFRGRAPFVVVCQDSFPGARDRVLDVRDELETNEAIRRDYGDLFTGSTRWTQADFETNEGARVKAVGAGGTVRGLLKRGRRPNLILVDDLENDQDVRNPELRENLHRWLLRALLPTGLAGEVLAIVVGTILHDDAVLARLLDTKREESADWLKRRYAARTDELGHPDQEGSRILWPEFWDAARLEKARRKIGPLAFAQEFLNQPVDDGHALFPSAWLKLAEARGDGRPFLYRPTARLPWDLVTGTWDVAEILERSPNPAAFQVVVTAWDLSIVDDEKKAAIRDTDYTAGISVALTATDRLEFRRFYRRRGMSPAEIRARIVLEYDAIRPDVVIVEANQAQSYLIRDLRDENPDLPIRGHTTGKEKADPFEGVPGLASIFELGRIDLCAATAKERAARAVLVDELHRLGFAAHDDTVMALWLAVLTIRRWQAFRDRTRRRRIGEPPGAYYGTFPQRVRPGGWTEELPP